MRIPRFRRDDWIGGGRVGGGRDGDSEEEKGGEMLGWKGRLWMWAVEGVEGGMIVVKVCYWDEVD